MTPDEVRAWDRSAVERFGVPEIVLMENAGRAVAEEALRLLGAARGAIAVVCGKGNNGGDGLVAARHLLAAGREARTLLLAPSAAFPLGSASGVNLEILRRLGAPVEEAVVPERLAALLPGHALVVDAILGTGLRGEVTGALRSAIEAVNGAGVPVLSVDIPSGLDGLTGEVRGAAIRARATVTFVAPKPGFFRGEGPERVGELKTSLLGLPADLP